MKKLTLLLAIFLVFASVGTVSAETATDATVQAQVDSINSLTEQITVLQAERKSKLSALIIQLRQGTRNDAVTALQTLLALDPSIYPQGLVTGYFGKLTSAAVKKFQARNGLEQVGYVGPRTVEKLKKLADENELTIDEDASVALGSTSGARGLAKKLCAIIPPGHFIAPGLLKKTGGVRPTVPTCQTLPKGIKDKIDGIKPLPDSSDKTAPVISDVATSELSAASVKVTWKTNENSKSKVWYGTANPLVTDTALSVLDNTLVTDHSLTVSSLTPSTVYYFIVGGADLAGNESKSAQGTFTTLAPDTTDPVISALTTSELTSTGVKITWTTDEGAKDKVWYGTADPVVTSGIPTAEDTTLRTAHTFTVTGLTAGTVYYYIVSSTDSSGNDAMSSQGTFTTLP